MQALILAALLNMPVAPACQQWLDLDQESKAAARLVWSPQKEAYIKRVNQAAEKVAASFYMDPSDEGQVADAKPVIVEGIGGAGY